jgi:hypothetical protein
MLELICHQTYTWDGTPADKSPYRNHGTGLNTGGSPDGAEPPDVSEHGAKSGTGGYGEFSASNGSRTVRRLRGRLSELP